MTAITPIESHSGLVGSATGAVEAGSDAVFAGLPGPQAASAQVRAIADIVFIFIELSKFTSLRKDPNTSVIQAFLPQVRKARRLW
jgi:hypothetical protein